MFSNSHTKMAPDRRNIHDNFVPGVAVPRHVNYDGPQWLLHVFTVPTRKDIDVLSRRVHELMVVTRKLTEEKVTHGRGRAHSAHGAKAA
ncbi:hypothetical protein DFR50_15431 [Roseiarcus fermentans]|uniref:Uncharacterized protein n=1 Tax=Roseiarcus fermentans TaxID=1473586 RepID=A0A366ELB0_9HYPH|nr:hypothetical protein DFR50_15431 [Roseiarcus fermentans]